MLQLTSKHKVFIGVQAVDFRKGIDGIVAICRSVLQYDPFSGHCFIFRNKRATAVKLLMYDAQGFWLCHKRLSAGSFKHWPSAGQSTWEISVAQLQVLLYNGDPFAVNTAADWRAV
ncbi:MAG: IS66 family insertion sequence element accessory protein TnpB [Rhizobiales bacterium]|nr:IS66 family insertion sequence element accessory protein TnpB [Hyphomicrobiales bacterium]